MPAAPALGNGHQGLALGRVVSLKLGELIPEQQLGADRTRLGSSPPRWALEPQAGPPDLLCPAPPPVCSGAQGRQGPQEPAPSGGLLPEPILTSPSPRVPS